MPTAGRFTEWRQIGKGAHGVVHGAFDNKLECEVAIKLLNKQARENRRLVEGMRREVVISRQLRHPNICPIHDIYEGPEGVGIVMDLIEGIDLKEWSAAHKGQMSATAPERLNLLIRVCEALVVAHSCIVHRDLKPANIFLKNGDIGKPVIMDFGISVLGGLGDGEISGTPRYMAPEQYTAPGAVDQRCDLFALGIIAYELFTGNVPPNSLRNVMKTKEPPRIPLEDIDPPSVFCPVIPPVLDRLILQLTAYERADRPSSADEALSVLRRVILKSPDVTPGAGAAYERKRVAVPGGTDYLGSPPTSANANEKPPRRVKLSPFLIDACPVSNRDYMTFIRATGRPLPPLAGHPEFGRENHPVVSVTFEEAGIFAVWAGGKLPTEAQWERAARGGVRFAEYPWGQDAPQPSQANINNVWRATSPVDAHPSGRNPFGIWDMCGNVWNWCADVFDAAFYRSLENDCVDPINNAPTGPRSLRGGSYQSFSGMGRCAFRSCADPGERRSDIGFRLVYDE
ncbi:MAG: hypothetical protein A3G18_08855 [Rhodospirillales bacterium RIFCSPLOWO2_12_FULL_58_28]|nr:MAG: hypothetical protein A3H92_01450 [Rhodospirillales bacterium RIFCSPLOWO2_02_FULL_58_16]OHC78415.1 MAG: hypothetical protein A3G18_08855 [Rhodospirillales bacterium RIFCSPLOWO2_12_FULL_58_28]